MPGVWYRPYWLPSLRRSQPYLTATIGIAVRDERRHEFATVEALRRLGWGSTSPPPAAK